MADDSPGEEQMRRRKNAQAGQRPPAHPFLWEDLLLRLFALSARRGAIRRQGRLHLFTTLLAGLGALLPLLIQHLLGAEELDQRSLAAIALAEAGANNAQVPTIALAVTRCHRVEQASD